MEYYRLQINTNTDSKETFEKVTKILGVHPSEGQTGNNFKQWVYSVEQGDTDPYYDFINSFLDIIAIWSFAQKIWNVLVTMVLAYVLVAGKNDKNKQTYGRTTSQFWESKASVLSLSINYNYAAMQGFEDSITDYPAFSKLHDTL